MHVKLIHSMVQTARLCFNATGMAEPDDDSRWTIEELMLPPRNVASTTHSVLGSALTHTLEEFVTGMPIREWIAALAGRQPARTNPHRATVQPCSRVAVYPCSRVM